MSASSEPPPPTLRLKIISMGDTLGGKTVLIKRFCEGKFVARYVSTIGVDYGVKPVRVADKDVRVNFFDLSGVEAHLEIRNEFYKDAHGGLLVFAMDNRASFEHLDAWVKEATEFGGGRLCPFVVLGNKCENKKAVTVEEAKKWCDSKGFEFFEVSASTGTGVDAAFKSVFTKAFEAAYPAK